MGESGRHKHYKRRAAGITGYTEHQLPSGRYIDAVSSTRIFTEVERGGALGIKRAVSRLKESLNTREARKARLSVPHSDLDIAYDEMRRQRVGGELTNLSRTHREHVPKRRK